MLTILKARWPWLVIIAGAMIGFAIVLIRHQPGSNSTNQSSSNRATAGAPTNTDQQPSSTQAGNDQRTIASDVRSVESYGSQLFYARGSDLFSLDRTKNGATPTKLTSLRSPAIEVRWRPDGKRALSLVSYDPVTWISSDIPAKKDVALTDTFVGPALASQRDRIIYTYEGPSGTNVSVADPDGQNWQAVTTPPDEIVRWWWPGDGTVAIGDDEAANPPQYVRLFLGQKKIEPIAQTYGSGLRLKFSPDETRILIDTGSVDHPTVSVADVSGGGVTTVQDQFAVRTSAWLDDHTAITVGQDGTVVALDFTKRTQTTLGQWPANVYPLDELAAVTAHDYYAVVGGNLIRVPR